MKVVWFKTKHKGLRFRKHPKRKHGVDFDRFYQFRHMTPDGRRREESFGWLSEGWNENRCLLEIATIRQAQTTGEGYQSLSEKRDAAEQKRKDETAAKAAEERENMTFAELWPRYVEMQTTKKPHTVYQEITTMKKWVLPAIGKKRLSSIFPLDLERIKKNLLDAGKAPRTAQYTLAMVRQVFNFASEHGFMTGENPSRKVKKLKFDNKRLRFLSEDEAQTLLDELKIHSIDLHDAALLSLHTGARAGEIFNLELRDINFQNETITLRDTKNTETRTLFMSDTVKRMFERRQGDILEGQRENSAWNPRSLLFPGRGGRPMKSVSRTFDRVIEKLLFNEGATDRRQKFTFHNLRHTAASWLVQHGVPLFTVQQILGHKTSALTARYAHLAPGNLQSAAKFFDQTMTPAPVVAEVIPMSARK